MTSDRSILRFAVVLIATITLFGFRQEVVVAQNIPSPEEFFGFQMGADRKLARWDKLVEYYEILGRESDRLTVVNMGQTTLDNPFLALFISSPENLTRLEALREINAKLSDPRGVPQQEIEQAILDGKVVVVQSMGLHSSEVASSQMAAELTYDLVTRTDDEVTRILDETIAIMIPSFNPDGEIMVTDWYNENVGTEYEGGGLPWLYHHYIGHVPTLHRLRAHAEHDQPARWLQNVSCLPPRARILLHEQLQGGLQPAQGRRSVERRRTAGSLEEPTRQETTLLRHL